MSTRRSEQDLGRDMSGAAQTAFERELAELLVSTLQLEQTPDSIAAESPLFGEGLGLDSIDALELVLAVNRDYGVDLRSGEETRANILSSLRNLASYVATHRRPAGA